MKKVKLVWILIVLLTGPVVVFAQGRRNGSCLGAGVDNRPGTCLSVLSGLSDEQKDNIMELNTAHQEAMAELRADMRSTADPVRKNEVRGEMLKKVAAHRMEVRNLLTEEQQKQLDLIQPAAGNRGRGLIASRGAGRGQGGCGRYRFRGGW